MKEVKIYIGTSLHGPCISKGNWAAIVECQTKKGPATRGIKGTEEKSTYYRLVLLAIVNALYLLNTACAVTVYTDCTFVKNMIEQGRPEQWQRAEWKAPAGGKRKNKELWQQYQELSRRHKIAVRFSKYNDYVEKLSELTAA